MHEEGYIKPHQIVYFEDPFGRTEYEISSELENYIGSIIDSIKAVQNAYLIITSREEVFKEFEREKLSEVELAFFEKKMNLKRASYDIGKRKEMLLRWARVNNSRWLLDSTLTNLILEAIELQELLPTPLNIRDFVVASHDVLDIKQIEDLMKMKSQEITRRFADEIMRMKEDEKVIFLVIAYIGRGNLSVELIKEVYYNIITSAIESNQKYYMDFEKVKRWFEADKINISDNKIAFSHPSYHEAFQYAIGSERFDSLRIRDIFVKVLLRLADYNEAAESVARGIADNFYILPSTVRERLLLKVADKCSARGTIYSVIKEYSNNLPEGVRKEILAKLKKKDVSG